MRWSVLTILLAASCGARSAPGGGSAPSPVSPDAAVRPPVDASVRGDLTPRRDLPWPPRRDARPPPRDSWPPPRDAWPPPFDLPPFQLDATPVRCGDALTCTIGCFDGSGEVGAIVSCMQGCIAHLCESGRNAMVALVTCAASNCTSCINGQANACLNCISRQCGTEMQSCLTHSCP